MNIKLLTNQVNDTVDEWIALLLRHSFDNLLKKPDSESWSLGQVAIHLVTETAFYMEQIEQCLRSNQNSQREMTEDAKVMFHQNAFPDIRIKREASLSQFYPRPENKADVIEKMQKLKVRLNYLLLKIETANYKGKSAHPGLGYLNAEQWVQFAEMHMRHHLRQKERIETALNLS